MCLISHRKEPFIAQKDLKVFKILTLNNGKLSTSYTNTPTNLGEIMVAEGDNRPTCIDGNYTFTKGYIHSLSTLRNHFLYSENVVVIAYIPKGTEYYIGTDNDICSKVLQLTDDIYEHTDREPFLSNTEWNDLYAPILDLIPKDEVGIGWILDYDHNLIHPSNMRYKNQVLAIVGGFDKDNNIIVVKPQPTYYQYFEIDFIKPWFMGTIEDYKNTIGKNLDVINMVLTDLSVGKVPVYSWTEDTMDDEHAFIYDMQSGSVDAPTDMEEIVIPLAKIKVINGNDAEFIN